MRCAQCLSFDLMIRVLQGVLIAASCFWRIKGKLLNLYISFTKASRCISRQTVFQNLRNTLYLETFTNSSDIRRYHVRTSAVTEKLQTKRESKSCIDLLNYLVPNFQLQNQAFHIHVNGTRRPNYGPRKSSISTNHNLTDGAEVRDQILSAIDNKVP